MPLAQVGSTPSFKPIKLPKQSVPLLQKKNEKVLTAAKKKKVAPKAPNKDLSALE